MDVDTLLQSHGEDAPSGEDLEYDPAFMEMEIAAQPKEAQQMGDAVNAVEETNYKEVIQMATAVMERSHDLRAGVIMAEAQLRQNGWAGFAKATKYMAGCLTEYWDSCHPQLDAEDDDDPTMRVNAVLSLADDARILRSIRRAPLTQSRMFGGISLRDIAVAEGEQTAPDDMENVPDPAQVAAAFQDTEEEVLAEIAEGVAEALANVEAINAAFDENTPGQGPDLDPLIAVIKKANSKLSAARGVPEGSAEDGEAVDTGADAGGAAPAPVAGGGGGVGGINSPTDVENALDRIIAYYERCEPSSPLPILLLRAKKLVNKDFLTIVKDMAPGGIDNVHLIGGISDEEEDDY